MPKIPLLTAGATVLALGLAACGGSSSSSSQSSSAAGGSSSATAPASGTSSAASSSSAAPSAGGGALALAANPSGQLKFSTTTLTAKAGTVKIDFTNMSPVAHNVTIEHGTSGPVVGATPTFSGGSKTLTVKLKPGTYTFFCSVPGHRMAGMQGTLTVQ